ncbi:MAG TPA: 50S ribosomal protein L9 [Bryobacteraceae bacterium]|nr:50S ribosomal protein L9 [Bryobacteraceae bacterium]
MELILREDLEKLGVRGQVVKVADGYARNFLLPKKLAVVANASNKKIVEQEREAHLRREAKAGAEAQDLGKLLSAVTVTISQKAGEEGHLFGSVGAKDIADALERQNFTIDRRKIQLADPIKQVGEYKVPVKLHKDVTVELPVVVVAE